MLSKYEIVDDAVPCEASMWHQKLSLCICEMDLRKKYIDGDDVEVEEEEVEVDWTWPARKVQVDTVDFINYNLLGLGHK